MMFFFVGEIRLVQFWIFTLTDDAWLVAAAVAGARAVSAVEGEGPIIWESIILVGRPTGSLI